MGKRIHFQSFQSLPNNLFLIFMIRYFPEVFYFEKLDEVQYFLQGVKTIALEFL